MLAMARRVQNLYAFKYKIRARPKKWLRAPCLFYLFVAEGNTKKTCEARRNSFVFKPLPLLFPFISVAWVAFGHNTR